MAPGPCVTRVRGASTAALAVLVALALPALAAAETLSGDVRLLDHGEPSADLSGTIVYYEPDGAVTKPAPVSAEITTLERRFTPRVIAVPLGSTVRFPNRDPIRHNVFSVSPGNRFDLGLYARGPGKAKRFDAPGVARLFCNVHHSMAAYVLVLRTPHYTTADAHGQFVLEGLPAGNGMLRVWNPRAADWSRPQSLPTTDRVEVRLDASLPPVPDHLNKFGRPYRDDSSDESYR